MKLYLDLCALKRPFDDQLQERIAAESRSVMAILGRIEVGLDSMVWSVPLVIENDSDPDTEVRQEVAKIGDQAVAFVRFTSEIERRVLELVNVGLGALDAAHLACAEAGGCHALLTCDDRFLRAARRSGTSLRVINPLEYWSGIHEDQ